jgi:hypothetical protein
MNRVIAAAAVIGVVGLALHYSEPGEQVSATDVSVQSVEPAPPAKAKDDYDLTRAMKDCLALSSMQELGTPQLHGNDGFGMIDRTLARCDIRWYEKPLAMSYLNRLFNKK